MKFIDHNHSVLEIEEEHQYMVCLSLSDPEDECTHYFYINTENYEDIIFYIRRLMEDPEDVLNGS